MKKVMDPDQAGQKSSDPTESGSSFLQDLHEKIPNRVRVENFYSLYYTDSYAGWTRITRQISDKECKYFKERFKYIFFLLIITGFDV